MTLASLLTPHPGVKAMTMIFTYWFKFVLNINKKETKFYTEKIKYILLACLFCWHTVNNKNLSSRIYIYCCSKTLGISGLLVHFLLEMCFAFGDNTLKAIFVLGDT